MELSLYLAAPLQGEILSSYCALTPEKLSQLKEYLEVIDFEGERFLGKKLGSGLSVDDLVTSQAHVSSLIHRFVPVNTPPSLNVISINL